MITHTPVLLAETGMYLNPRSNGYYVDGTFGAGGHTRLILERLGSSGKLLGLDRDPEAIDQAPSDLCEDPRLILRQGHYGDLPEVQAELSWPKVNGIVLDLGLSSTQLGDPDRGFSFQHEGPLDLRFNQTEGEPASAWINRVSERELTQVLRDYGELYAPHRLAQNIVTARRERSIQTTGDLLNAVPLASPQAKAQLFQALRIVVNQELAGLQAALPKLWETLLPGGRLVIISFHSLEDRIVKHQFRIWQKANEGTILTKKPIQASAEEHKSNPRARSAKLRAIEKEGHVTRTQ